MMHTGIRLVDAYTKTEIMLCCSCSIPMFFSQLMALNLKSLLGKHASLQVPFLRVLLYIEASM